MCPDQCEELCRSNLSSLGKFVFYPGLTPAEKKLIEQSPKDALTVFIQKTRAEASSARNFPEQALNDESDAFRHFLLAGLLTRELGAARAEEFLDAHEEDPAQPEREREMDNHNNERGQLAARTLIKQNRWNQNRLESMGLDELRGRKLKVIKPGLSIPKEPR